MRIETSIDIDAPAGQVWAALVDFPSYADWNPFVIRVRGAPVVGEAVRLTVVLGGRKMGRTHVVSRVDAPTTLAWTIRSNAPWWIRGERVQRVEALGPNRCRYTNDEQVHGLLGGIVGPLMGASVRAGLEAAGQGLKAHCERA